MPDLMASSKLFVEDDLISVTRAIDIYKFSFLFLIIYYWLQVSLIPSYDLFIYIKQSSLLFSGNLLVLRHAVNRKIDFIRYNIVGRENMQALPSCTCCVQCPCIRDHLCTGGSEGDGLRNSRSIIASFPPVSNRTGTVRSDSSPKINGLGTDARVSIGINTYNNTCHQRRTTTVKSVIYWIRCHTIGSQNMDAMPTGRRCAQFPL
jgi:hypothetical protein